MNTFETVISPLFVPGNRPERYAKAAASDADAIILDLEDAVADAEKGTARAGLHTGFTNKPIIIRINAAGTDAHEDDIRALSGLKVSAVMLPKAEQASDFASLQNLFPVIALVESVRGVANVRALARHDSVARIAFGSVDYAANLGCAHERIALAAARAEIVFASRLAGLPAPLDGVTTDVLDMRATADDANYASTIGFGGKLAVHPRQVAPIRNEFQPSAAQLDWAERVLASGQGVSSIDGEMIDEPVRSRARSLIERSRRGAA